MKDLGTYAAWKATKTTGQFDLKTFEVKASPMEKVELIFVRVCPLSLTNNHEREREEICSLMASHADGSARRSRVTPALSLLHGHRSIVLLHILHDPDGFGTCRTNLPVGAVDMDDSCHFTQHCPQSGCFRANRLS